MEPNRPFFGRNNISYVVHIHITWLCHFWGIICCKMTCPTWSSNMTKLLSTMSTSHNLTIQNKFISDAESIFRCFDSHWRQWRCCALLGHSYKPWFIFHAHFMTSDLHMTPSYLPKNTYICSYLPVHMLKCFKFFFGGVHEIGLVPYTCRNYTCGKAQQVLNISNTANITHSCLYLHFDMATGCDISFDLSITYLNHIGSTWIQMAPWKRTLYLLKLSACWRCEPSWKKLTLHRAVAHGAKSAFLWEE